MAESYSARAGQSQPSAQLPIGLNPRLELVRDNLGSAIKALAELRARLGIPDPPDSTKAELAAAGAAGTTMDLLAQSARLGAILRETQEQVG